ncbi:MAG: hypothetical protein KBA66_09580 [Leptospiraceae bacterium]|nr:hypothetical protein [Leptospiraceae bacterium]
MYRILSIFFISILLLFSYNCKKAAESSNSFVGHWQGNAEVTTNGEAVLTANVHANFTEDSYTINNEGKAKTGDGGECEVKVASEGSYTSDGTNLTIKPTKETMSVCGKDIPTKLEPDTYKVSLEGDNLTLSLDEGDTKTITTLKKQ